MLLSFSVPEMLPYIRAGIRQVQGAKIGTERVKRQTVRALGPRAKILLSQATPGYSHPGTLHLWWKSRTKDREFLGAVKIARIYAVTVKHYLSGTLAIEGPAGTRAEWFQGYGPKISEFARADGFDSAAAFRDYFVPEAGDVFEGVLYKW